MEQIKEKELIDIKTAVRQFIIENFLFGAEPENMGDEDSCYVARPRAA